MNFVININGDTYESMYKSMITLHEALLMVEKALPATAPNGRNYQTLRNAPEAFSEDAGAYRAALGNVIGLRHYVDEMAYRLMKLKED